MKKVSKKAVKIVKTEIKKLIAEVKPTKAKTFVNPFRDGSNYSAIVAALLSLGKGKQHDYALIIKTVKAKMGKDFKEFASKKKQNKNGLDANGKIIQNLNVLCRSDYGSPIHKQGFEIRRDGSAKVAGLYAKNAK